MSSAATTALAVYAAEIGHTVATGDLLWSHAGQRGVAQVNTDGTVTVAVAHGKHTHTVTVTVWGADGWAPALCCDYCDRPATLVERDSGCPSLYCQPCARRNFDTPREWVRPLTPGAIRTAYAAAYC